MKNKKKKSKSKLTKDDLKNILKYFKKYKYRIIIACIFMFILELIFILTGYLNGQAVEAITENSLNKSVLFLIIYFFTSTVGGSLSRFCTYILSKYQTIISREIGFETYKKAMQLPAYAFEEMSSGEIINRITSDTETIVGSVEELVDISSRIICAIILYVYIICNSYIVALEIFVFLILYSFVLKYFNQKLKKNYKESKTITDKYTSLSNESIRGIREIKTLGIISIVTKEVQILIKKLLKTSTNIVKIERDYDMWQIIMSSILECGTFITCVILVYNKEVSIGFFIAMTYYIYRYMYIIQTATSFSKKYEQFMVSLERITEILNNKLYKDVSYGDINLKNIKGEIKFNNVTFNYKDEKKLLKNFNVTFEPNKKIAIIGASGEGKSTLFNLLTRLFDVEKGNITIDGVDIKDLTEESLRKNISIIRQEPFIFNKTIMENFKMIDEKVTIEEVRKYCKLACLDEYIMSLPKNYDTLIGEGGVNLSGGQKQRLAIARTLLKKSKIILFDEATSALDNESQKYIKESIDSLVKDHTVLIVAHRLSTIIDADVIYIVKDGKVLTSGNHKTLMSNCEYYQKLYTSEDKTI